MLLQSLLIPRINTVFMSPLSSHWLFSDVPVSYSYRYVSRIGLFEKFPIGLPSMSFLHAFTMPCTLRLPQGIKIDSLTHSLSALAVISSLLTLKCFINFTVNIAPIMPRSLCELCLAFVKSDLKFSFCSSQKR